MVRHILRSIFVMAALLYVAAAQSPTSLREEQDYAFALGLFNDGGYQMALNKFREFIDRYPGSALREDAEYYVAESLYQMESLADAATAFARFQSARPASKLADDAGFREGEVYYRQGNFSKAFDQFSTVVRSWPRGNLAHESAYWAGEAAFRQADYEQALRYYRIAYEHYPEGRIRDYAFYSVGFVREKQKRFDEALAVYEEFLTSFPESALRSSVFTRKGACLFQRADYNAASDWLEGLGDSPDPENAAERLFLRAEARYKLGRHAEAEVLYQSFLQAYPDNVRAGQVQYALGWTQLEQDKFSEAIATFDGLSRTSGELAEAAAFRKGVALRLNGNLEAARVVFREIIQQKPGGSYTDNAHFELGMAAYAENAVNKAETHFRTVTSSFPGSDVLADAWFMLGETRLKQQLAAEAADCYAAAVAVEQAQPDLVAKALFRQGFSLHKAGKHREAAIVLRNFTQRFPAHAYRDEGLLWLAEALFKAEDFDEAVAAYTRVLESTRDAALIQDALYGLGWTQFRRQDFIEAERVFRRLTTEYRAGKHDVDANVRLGDALYAQKRFEDAAKTYRYTSRMYPNNPLTAYALLQLASSEHRNGATPSAISTLRGMLARFGESEYADKAQFSLGWMYFQSKDYDVAIAEFTKLIADWPQSPLVPQAKYTIADCKYNKGVFREAEQAYRRVLTEHPDSRLVSDALDGLAQSLRMQGKNDEAEHVKEKWLRENPGGGVADGVAFAEARTAAESLEAAQAIPLLQRFIAAHPTSANRQEAFVLLGGAFRRNGDMIDAERTLKEAVAMQPRSEQAAEALFELIETAAALQQWNKALAISDSLRNHPRARAFRSRLAFQQGRVHRSAGNFADARAAFQSGSVIVPADNWTTYSSMQLALLDADEKKADSALLRLESIAGSRVDVIGAEAQYHIGNIHLSERKFAQAEEALLRVGYVYADAAPWTSRALLLLGRTYEAQGRMDKAREMYAKVREQFAGSDEAAEAERRMEMAK